MYIRKESGPTEANIFGKKKAALKLFYGGVERPAFKAMGRYTWKWLDRFQLATLLFADNHSEQTLFPGNSPKQCSKEIFLVVPVAGCGL